MLLRFCLTCFEALFSSVVLCCRYSPKTTEPCSKSCQFFNWSNSSVLECNIAHCQSVAILCMLFKIIGATRYTILVTLYSIVWHWWFSEQGHYYFYYPQMFAPFLSSLVFPFSSFFLCVGIVWLGSSDRYQSLTPGLALPALFNNNNNNINNMIITFMSMYDILIS